MDIESILIKEFNIKRKQVTETIKLIDEKNTIPFIARYRKEVTGGLSDEILRNFNERLLYLRGLNERKKEVKRLIEEQGKLDEKILKDIESSKTLQKLEDIYRPFRPKKKTRASVARERGLEPLSEVIRSNEMEDDEIRKEAKKFISEELKDLDEILGGAMDIIAEEVADSPQIRQKVRENVYNNSFINTEIAKEEEKELFKNYEMYFGFNERLSKIADHRVLAINRAEKEKAIKVKIEPIEEKNIKIISKYSGVNEKVNTYFKMAIEDSFKRLIFPSIEREIRNILTEKAENKSIEVFGQNLKPLLMQPPIQKKVVMGFDPGYRTGCKVAVLDETGKLLDYDTIYMTSNESEAKKEKAKEILKDFIRKYNVELIAIGNGTASRESEAFISELIKEIEEKVHYMIVNEAGASIYSASKLGTEEYPEIDVTIRGAISIGKRVQDPLAELVKIEPKHIGVGQYQHDLNQKKLNESLKGVVESCVNNVGVDINTASPALLKYVSGINSTVAKNILEYRNENGKFKNRQELLNVKRLGNNTFKQCAGFLRIPDSENILDRTAVHPESYEIAEKLLDNMNDLKIVEWEKIENDIEKLAEKLNVGVPTLKDIITELKKPGRDPRENMPKPIFRTDVLSMEDLKIGMILKGTIRNIVDFGAFIDIGLKNDGLIHISEISYKRIKSVSDILSTGQNVDVKVIEIDSSKNRVSLSIKQVD